MEGLMKRAHLEISYGWLLRAVASWVLSVPEDGDSKFSSLPWAPGTRVWLCLLYSLTSGPSQAL